MPEGWRGFLQSIPAGEQKRLTLEQQETLANWMDGLYPHAGAGRRIRASTSVDVVHQLDSKAPWPFTWVCVFGKGVVPVRAKELL